MPNNSDKPLARICSIFLSLFGPIACNLAFLANSLAFISFINTNHSICQALQVMAHR